MLNLLHEDLYFYIFDILKYEKLLNLRIISKKYKNVVDNYFYFKNKTIFNNFNTKFLSLYQNITDYENNEFKKFLQKQKSNYNLFVIKHQLQNKNLDQLFIYNFIKKIKFKKINNIRCIDLDYLNCKNKILDFLITNNKIKFNSNYYYNLAELSAIYGDHIQLSYLLKNYEIKLNNNFIHERKENFFLLNSYELVFDIKNNSLKCNFDLIENILMEYFLS